jgi:hypothetical protein
MRTRHSAAVVVLIAVVVAGWSTVARTHDNTDSLPSWNDGPAKKAITDFVTKVTTPGGREFVSLAERIATFDNDGTLWCEQPMYVQLAFALDRVKALAGSHPEWKDKMPFRAALDRDFKALSDIGTAGRLELVMATHAGITTGDFTAVARDWLATARHPRFQRPYTDLVYQPRRRSSRNGTRGERAGSAIRPANVAHAGSGGA